MTEGEIKSGGLDEDDVTRPADRAPSDSVEKAAAGESVISDPGASAAAVGPGSPATLKRLAPQESEGEIVALSADDYLLGRSHSCTIPLLSATASRQHARIVGRNGAWFLCPLDGKTVIVNGRPVFDELRLRHDTRMQLGADELVFLQEEIERTGPEREEETLVISSQRVETAAVSIDEPARPGAIVIAVGCAVALMAGLAFWLLL